MKLRTASSGTSAIESRIEARILWSVRIAIASAA